MDIYAITTGAGTGLDYKLNSISKINDKTYKGKVSYILEERTEEAEYEFGIENYNGKCVIDYCNKTNSKIIEENNSIDENEEQIITQLTPSGFAGSSKHRVELNTNKEVYVIIFDGNGYTDNNVTSRELIAKNVESISKNNEGSIIIKGGEKVKDTFNWIIFEQEDIKYDVEIPLSEIENIKVSIDNKEIKDFYQKYKGKIIKVTGYVSDWGDEFDSDLGVDLATGVNIGNSQSYKTKIYAYGVTYNSDIINKIHNLKEGEKIILIGTLSNSWSQPVGIYLTNIVKE